MAFPKHPHANTHWLSISTTAPSASVIILVPNGSQFAVYHVSHVKNAMITPVKVAVSRGNAPMTMATPSKISPTQMNTASGNTHSVNPGRFKAPGSKYSSSLYMKPKASLALMSPDTMKSDPTKRRQILMMVFHMDMILSIQINSNREVDALFSC